MAFIAVAAAGCASSGGTRYREAIAVYDRAPVEAHADPDEDPFGGEEALGRENLVSAVLRRNAGPREAREAWRAALLRWPQVTALDDPKVSYALAPISIFDAEAPYGHEIKIEQMLPFPGKLALEGEMALAAADAARERYEDARIELALMAARMFDEYYAVHRELEISARHIELVEELSRIARTRYEVGRASQQDPLAAEVEKAELRRERVMLEAERDAILARLNGLLHRRQGASLPPPRDLPPAPPNGSPAELEREALERRPELRASRARIRGGQAGVDRAKKEYLPDLGVMASYSSMWDVAAHRFMVGVTINLPLWLDKRGAGVDQAQAEVRMAEAELDHMATDIRAEVAEAHRRLVGAEDVVRAYDTEILPIARERLGAARAGFVTGMNDFASLIEAERMLREKERGREQARAAAWTRRAALERALGRVPGLPNK